MSRLIDADALQKALANMWYDSPISITGLSVSKLIDEQPTVPQWIPCSERLPEYGIEVLTFNRDGEYKVNHIIDEEDGEWFWEGVTAWCELPEPYKEADNERVVR